MRKRLLILLGLVSVLLPLTACVKEGHNFPSDGLPLGGTTWRAENTVGAFREVSTLYFYAGGEMERVYETFDNDVPRIIDRERGTFVYESPEGSFTVNNATKTFLVNGKQMYLSNYPMTHYCIQGRD